MGRWEIKVHGTYERGDGAAGGIEGEVEISHAKLQTPQRCYTVRLPYADLTDSEQPGCAGRVDQERSIDLFESHLHALRFSANGQAGVGVLDEYFDDWRVWRAVDGGAGPLKSKRAVEGC